MLRATEREQGALDAEDRASAYERGRERDHFRALAIGGLQSAANAYATLGTDLEAAERGTDGGASVKPWSRGR